MTEQQFFIHLYNRIITGELMTFSRLADYAGRIKTTFSKDAILLKCFHLLKELNWGFFKQLQRKIHTRLWKELVIPHPRYPDAGDLKRNNSIGKVYVALLDIHGYTRFCQESKKNLSQLHALDDFMSKGVAAIGSQYSAICQRERGDEVLVVAASATDIMSTTLGIIASFSRKIKIFHNAVYVNRQDYSVTLPDFEISAGIAGGNTETPLIISENGNLSGFLINMAARLQMRSNKLSPNSTRIMIANTVHSNFIKENQHGQSRLATSGQLAFCNTGPIRFKGVRISLYDVLFQEEMHYKKKLEEAIERLLAAQKSGHWQQLVFFELIALIEKSIEEAPAEPEGGRAALLESCATARNHYAVEEDYYSAITLLGKIIEDLKKYPGFDLLIIDYARDTHNRYAAFLETYNSELIAEIETHLEAVFPQENLRKLWVNSRRTADAWKKLLSIARKSRAVPGKKKLWYAHIAENLGELKNSQQQKKF